MGHFGKRFAYPLTLALSLGTCLTAAPQTKTEMSVQLPPFIVDSTIGPTWRYTEINRFEILSRCNDLTTDQLVLAVHRANELLDLVLPERFRLLFDVPQTVIFYDEELWPVAEQEAVAAMLRANAPARPDADQVRNAPPRVQLEPITGSQLLDGNSATQSDAVNSFFGNVMLSDADVVVTFALISKSTIDPYRTHLTTVYVRNLLENRAPALPDWFTAGFMRLYDRMTFGESTVTVQPLRWDAVAVPQANPGDEFRPHTPPTNPPATIPTPELFQPLGEFVSGVVPAEAIGLWLDQAELFVSWGLDPANGRVDAFWKCIDRIGTEPMTEALFEECLGLNYAAATRSIIAYSTNHRGIRWVLPQDRARPPAYVLKDASSLQIARIKGDWERLEARYVRKNQPDLETQYAALARRTLRRAYDREERDPRLVASLGLLELDAGNNPEATKLLEEAAQGNVVHPRVYFELARLRYDHLFGRSTRNDGKFPAEQIDPILGPLLIAARQAPALPAVFELMAHVSALGIEAPPPEVVAALDHGTILFPRDEGLRREMTALREGTKGTQDSLELLHELNSRRPGLLR